MAVKWYLSKTKAEKAASVRSRNAHANGQYSQFALVQPVGASYAAGELSEVQRLFPNKALIGQWSAGYRCA